ncbi:MAG: hypothetical protein UT39_C0004G0004 [Candidatus Woesebacteria bacterium GW2011_GWA1_39_21]|uniref:Uncharacterized protein n=1 Tax=Candidatus Woesebacteria bacterium GW2011_GWA1_39_21 TaxID=1618550 RepID=A0A0G0QMQ7_9BACT|nr:MAG: hypothetical protein UT39_C0004G0004 [Candidatus Woesebacteria bacterium GW2011_GWA1_39_21]
MENKKMTKTKEEEAVVTDVKAIPKDVGKAARKKNRSWILLLVIDLLMLGFSVFFIVSIPTKAEALNKARSDEQKVKESKNVDVTGLEYKPTKDSVDTLNSYYPEEAGLISFIEAVDKLKESGIIKNFSLVGKNAVKDKTGVYGIPFIIEIEGKWEDINANLQEFQKLPYLIRAVNVEANVIDLNIVNFKYGGFLYVSDKLAKTR